MFFSAWTVAGSTAAVAGAAVCADAPGAAKANARASRPGVRICECMCFSQFSAANRMLTERLNSCRQVAI